MGFTEATVRALPRDFERPFTFRSENSGAIANTTSIVSTENGTELSGGGGGYGFIQQERFVADGVSKVFTVTETEELPENASDVMVTRNGLFLSEKYFASLDSVNGTLELTFTPDNGDIIVIIWFIKTVVKGNIFQEIFSGGSNTFTTTSTLTSRVKNVFAFVNGLHLDYAKFVGINGNTITLNYTPSADDSLAFVWFQTFPNQLKVVQEQIVASGSSTFTLTENEGKIPSTSDHILVVRNGQHISNNYISGINETNATVTLSFAPDAGDEMLFIWFLDKEIGTEVKATMFQEQLDMDGTTNVLQVTQNEGKLPNDLAKIMLYRNGQFISNNFVESYSEIDGTINLLFTPRNGEKFTVVWVI
jgi:hypothetical protein